ncbi:MAG: hypothetical protein QOI95_1605 [Acidimicrobiaceae bacterium]|jgi:uncharacterized membrane protein SpoIIM required for sporulation
MDLDRFVVRNAGAWRRLEELTSRTRRSGQRALAPAEVDELVALYQRTAAQLSHARSYYEDPGLTSRLTILVAAANAAIYGSQPVSIRSLGRFFTDTFPAAVYVNRRFIAAAAALMFVPALAMGTWMISSDEALNVAVPKEEQEALLQTRFEDYYSSAPAAEFSTRVLINNIQVSFLAFSFGVFLCIGTAFILFQNGVNIGIAGGLFIHAHQAGKFFGLILPHGLLELTAITIAGAAGLRLGWTVIAPGDRPRGEALAEEGRRAVVIVLGLMLCFIVAGLIEGFVTPSGLPVPVRVGIGVLVEVSFIFWIVTRGRIAVERGLTGRFGEEPRPTADLLPST